MAMSGGLISEPHHARTQRWLSAKFFRRAIIVRREDERDIPFQFVRSCGHELSPLLQYANDVVLRAVRGCERRRGQRMQSHFEFGDDAKVSTTSAQCPVKLGIFGAARANQRSIGRDQSKAGNVVARQSEQPCKPTSPA